MSKAPLILWFRRDLRLSDHPALNRAVETDKPIIALYIDETSGVDPLGAAGRWWLHYSLKSLSEDLSKKGVELTLRRGAAKDVLAEIISETGADHIVWTRRYDKLGRATDTQIKSEFKERGVLVESFNGSLLTEPWSVTTKTGGYYKVFTPYWRSVTSALEVLPPLSAPPALKAYSGLGGVLLEDLNLLPTHPDWGTKMAPFWTIGEAGAQVALKAFIAKGLSNYAEDRNRPDKDDGTSKLSPHLAFGEISPRQIWQACYDQGAGKYLAEIGWREFSYVLLFHNPDLAVENFKADFNGFEWNNDPQNLLAWQNGLTGYPYIDAGMRQLWQTGWQHNRVRMATASFLIKHLLIDWREGEHWFYDTLVDYDPASNAASWQWVAGSGADAAPYFRIFNPITQGEKFDPNGDYVRRFVPELSGLPKKYIHKPWDAPDHILEQAGVVLGKTYPKPIVDHKMARERALARYKLMRGEA